MNTLRGFLALAFIPSILLLPVDAARQPYDVRKIINAFRQPHDDLKILCAHRGLRYVSKPHAVNRYTHAYI